MSKLRGADVFLVVLLLALPACAVAQPRAQAQAFESISVQRSQSNSSRNMRVRVMPNGDLKASSVHTFVLVSYAYDLPLNSSLRFSAPLPVAGLYDVEAKAPANAIPADLPAREKWIRMQRMLRALLADRFKLVMRVEQKTMPVYVLTVASGGPKFQKSSIADKDCLFEFNTPGSCHGFANDRRGHPLTSPAVTMDDLALYIENWTDLPVVNRTSLDGLFAVEGEGWKPMKLPPRPPEFPQVPNFDDLPSIFTVLGKLGLELKQQEASVPVYTVEHIERPVG